ncbi:CoA transferase [Sphingomonas sp. CL5.1]|uniref:CaiB/BaiF CoA transferase family protein n=1 Tax=Sphingomonas sp. CL5.1 TaxID=2653203 RepID=UPI00158265E4|nr:CoA transferase [Sphingomonas sp. CL5.1]QKS00604.1 CoA transferase [Sphingomonas sp. CL5.1]
MKIGEVRHPERARFGKPLDGVRILALEQQQALPFATQLLARLGADVVRLEHPERGDTSRLTHPHVKDPKGAITGSTFLRNNMNKRSIAVDIKSEAGREIIRKLACRFDVFAENFRAGTLDRLNLGYADLAPINPRLIYASISGFGMNPASPYFGQAAFAPIVEALSAFYDFKRKPDQAPVIGVAGALGDTATAMFAAVGILAALRHRDATGDGQHIDIAMYDTMVSMVDVMINYYSLGKPSTLTPANLTAGFRAKDGYFVLQCTRQPHFVALARIVDRPEWIEDQRLQNGAGWGAHIEDVIRPAVEDWATNLTRDEACAIIANAGIAVGKCQSIQEVIADPHIVVRDMIVSVDRVDGVTQPALVPGNPIKLSNMAEGPERRAPWLGEHTSELLEAELGLSPREIAELAADGIVSCF